MRRSSSFNTGRIDHIFDKLHLHHGDMTDAQSLFSIVSSVEPTEVYNLAAQSHVRVSFENPVYTANATAIGTMNLLEAVRCACPEARFYQASSSEQFGTSQSNVEGRLVQHEKTPFHPRSPYAAAKVYAHSMAVNYREAYDMHISCGILFNHESPRRGETFVTRKISRAVARIAEGQQDHLYLGNVHAMRDWGFAGDYVKAMHLMARHDIPDDYVIATGESHTVLDFVERAFNYVNLRWEKYVVISDRYMRPTEVPYLCGDASKARRVLDWTPKVSFDDLVVMMVKADIDDVKNPCRPASTQC